MTGRVGIVQGMSFDDAIAAAREWHGRLVDVSVIRGGTLDTSFTSPLRGTHGLSDGQPDDDTVLNFGAGESSAAVFLYRRQFRGAEIRQHGGGVRELLIRIDGGEISL